MQTATAPAAQTAEETTVTDAHPDYAKAVAFKAKLTPGAVVREHDDDGSDNPITWGKVAAPTAEELRRAQHELEDDVAVMVLVQWSPQYRSWEYVEDLRTR